MDNINWSDLFKHIDRNGELAKLEELHREINQLRSLLDEKRIELMELQRDIRSRIDGAIRVAGMLGIEAPTDATSSLGQLSIGDFTVPTGGYIWRPAGRVSFRASISRAMWRLSAGSGGSAGTGGVLTAREFRRFVGNKAWAKLVSGEELTIVLPNGLTVSIAKATKVRRILHDG